MNCEEFLRQFREALDGKVPEGLIQDNMNYYRSYINNQIANGRSESEVLNMLGEPRLLAKTIEESSKFAAEDQSNRNGYANDNYAGYGGYSNNVNPNKTTEYAETENERHIKLQGWLVGCIVVIAVILFLTVAFRVLVFLAPVIIVFVFAGFLVRTIKSWWNGR